MQLKTLLNRVEKHKGFVFGKPRFESDEGGQERIEVSIRPS